MRKSKTIIISLILVLLIVIYVANALQKSYSKITTEKAKSVLVVKEKDKKNTPKEGLQVKVRETTTATEAKEKKVVVIDPGHANRSNLEKEPIAPNSSEMKIKDGGGAEGVVSRIPEYLVNMKVSEK